MSVPVLFPAAENSWTQLESGEAIGRIFTQQLKDTHEGRGQHTQPPTVPSAPEDRLPF